MTQWMVWIQVLSKEQVLKFPGCRDRYDAHAMKGVWPSRVTVLLSVLSTTNWMVSTTDTRGRSMPCWCAAFTSNFMTSVYEDEKPRWFKVSTRNLDPNTFFAPTVQLVKGQAQCKPVAATWPRNDLGVSGRKICSSVMMSGRQFLSTPLPWCHSGWCLQLFLWAVSFVSWRLLTWAVCRMEDRTSCLF